ncbi:MAG: hypothetical protein GX640_06275 [Fibrobacter sp.]|nr:hypothetical protein [Fibrobacter sp.]
MSSTTFIDTDIDPGSYKILDIGCVKDNGNTNHSSSIPGFSDFLKNTTFICGHNILNHDRKYIQDAVIDAGIHPANYIDTLYLSPLLFPKHPYHALVKDDKLQSEERNNPLNDALKARSLFYDEVNAFQHLHPDLQKIFFQLLKTIRSCWIIFTIVRG